MSAVCNKIAVSLTTNTKGMEQDRLTTLLEGLANNQILPRPQT